MKLTCEGCKHYRGEGRYNSYEYLTYCHDCIRYQAKDNWEPAERSLEEICSDIHKVRLYKCKDAEDT